MKSQSDVAIVTYGCKVNYYESEAVMTLLTQCGVSVQMVSDGALSQLASPRVFVVNSCAVTSMAEKKTRYGLAKIKKYHPQAAVVTMGCALGRKSPEQVVQAVLAELQPVVVSKATSEIDSFTCDQTCFVDNSENVVVSATGNANLATTNATTDILVQHAREKAFIKVQDGCQNFCSYCIIPYKRKQLWWRKPESVVAEINAQAAHVTQIVLCGINLCYYPHFADLCLAVDRCGRQWSISSLEPPMMTPELIDVLAQCVHFVPHFHLCLQSGSDQVLSDMNRHYTTAAYARCVQTLRARFPQATFATDIIVGYPTETAQAFAETYAFLKKLRLDKLHVFPFSPRPGTPAAALCPLPNAVVTARAEKLRNLSEQG